MISIIIPTLNEEKILEKTLKSLRDLTEVPYEIIVSDGRSTDRTLEIAHQYADKVMVYEGTTRQTIANGRNLGGMAASGSHLVFLDADMTIPDINHFFRKALLDFEADPRLVGLTAYLKVLPEYANIPDKVLYWLFNHLFYVLDNVLHYGVSYGEFQMVRADIYKKLNGYNEALAVAEDHEFFKRVSRQGNVRIDPTLVVFHTSRRAHKVGWPRLCGLGGSTKLRSCFEASLPTQNGRKSDNSMKISLIIPAYNEEQYIGMCLDAVQKYGKNLFEVIVVDNASADRTSQVAQNYPFVRVVHQPKKGLTAARQCGFDTATGDLIAYIDADTLITPGWVDTIERNFKKYPHIVALSGPRRYFGTTWYRLWLLDAMWSVAPLTYRLVGYMILGGNFVAKKEAITAIGGFDQSIQFYGEDTDIARRLSTVGKVMFRMDFRVYAAARRFESEGIWKPNITYMLNYIWPVFFGRPYTQSYEDIR